jgi:hypothetical protein
MLSIWSLTNLSSAGNNKVPYERHLDCNVTVVGHIGLVHPPEQVIFW